MILEVKNISYYYKTQKDKLILDNVSYQFECGKMYAILGVSGSGKTTLLSLLAGLDIPVKGEIYYDGQLITRKELTKHRRHNVSLVFQSYNLIDYLTPLENVKLGGRGNHERLLESIGIGEELWNRSVLQLSGGQQQRVAIARALASDAKVLLADEPTGNLDEATVFDVIGILKNIAHKEKKCVIVVTHSKELADEADVIIRIGNTVCDKKRNEMKDFDGMISQVLKKQMAEIKPSAELMEKIKKIF